MVGTALDLPIVGQISSNHPFRCAILDDVANNEFVGAQMSTTTTCMTGQHDHHRGFNVDTMEDDEDNIQQKQPSNHPRDMRISNLEDDMKVVANTLKINSCFFNYQTNTECVQSQHQNW